MSTDLHNFPKIHSLSLQIEPDCENRDDAEEMRCLSLQIEAIPQSSDDRKRNTAAIEVECDADEMQSLSLQISSIPHSTPAIEAERENHDAALQISSLPQSTSSDDLDLSTAAIEAERENHDAEEEEEEMQCRTPSSDEHKIPATLICPPAPRKPRKILSCKRKLFGEIEFFEINNRDDVDAFFESSFQMIRRRTVAKRTRSHL